MSNLETLWKNKADETLLDAGKNLNSFSSEAIAIIIDEHKRRGLPIPEIVPVLKSTSKPSLNEVILTGVDIPYRTMAGIIFKWSLATVPTVLFWLVVVELLLKIK